MYDNGFVNGSARFHKRTSSTRFGLSKNRNRTKTEPRFPISEEKEIHISFIF